jgi:hypothetical protein
MLAACCLVAVGGLSWCDPAPAQAASAAIPPSRGTTLAGIRVALPDAVKGEVGVLVVGFTKDSKTQVEGWGRRLAGDYAAPASGVVYFEIPVLASAPSLVRPVIEEEMKMSLPAAERAHFLPLTQDEAGWLAVTQYVKGDDAYVLVIGGDGAVRWRAQGPVTDASYAELKSKIAGTQVSKSEAIHSVQ